MTVPREVEMEIRRLHQAEHWPVDTIAKQLCVHGDVVKRVLKLVESRMPPAPRPLLVLPYKQFIIETLEKYPGLRATRLYDMVRPRGYEGSVRTLREYVSKVRPRRKAEAYLRLAPLIGEQGQVDWAHVTRVKVKGGERALWLFVMVLPWSRGLWGEFVFDLGAHSLGRSLVRAAAYFGGTPREWLFDNPKAVVVERHGDAVRFHPLLLDVSSHYCVGVKVCGVRKPNQKGSVERAIRYLRERFLAGRTFHTREQSNRELWTFLDEVAHARPHPTLPDRTVADCLAEERQRLMPLPNEPAPVEEVAPVNVDKTAFVHFNTNMYSVPPAYAEGTLTLVATDTLLRLLDGSAEVARHPRCWGKRQLIELPEHRAELLAQKRRARQAKGRELLLSTIPGLDALFARWVEAGRNVGNLTARTLRLLELYGAPLLTEATAEVLSRGMHDPGALAVFCEQRRRAASQPLPVEVQLGNHVPDKDVFPHPLDTYDIKPH